MYKKMTLLFKNILLFNNHFLGKFKSINFFSGFFYLIFVFVFLFTIFGTPERNAHTKLPQNKNGLLDLKAWNFEKNGLVYLETSWQFYWKKLYSPKDLALKNIKYDFIVPSTSWKNIPSLKMPHVKYGYATYKLTLKGLKANQIYGVYIPDEVSAYKLWIDNKIIATNGIVGTSRKKMSPEWKPQFEFFVPKKNQIELVMQISNFNYTKGGMWNSFYIGKATQIQSKQNQITNLNIFILGCIFLIAFIHFVLFLLRNKDLSYLYFSICCFLVSLSVFVTGYRTIMVIFPHLNWEFLVKLQVLSQVLSVGTFSLFLYSQFRKDFNKIILKIILTLTVLLSIPPLIFPARIYSTLFPVNENIIALIVLYLGFVCTKAFLKKRECSTIIFIGCSILASTTIKSLVYNKGDYLYPYGLVIFIFFQMIAISQRFTQASNTKDLFNEKLIVVNAKLSQYSKQQEILNKELCTSIMKLQKTQEKLTQSERISANTQSEKKFLVNILSDISHQLKTPLSSLFVINNALMYRNIDDKKKKYFLENSYLQLKRMEWLIKSLLLLARIDSGAIQFDLKNQSLSETIFECIEAIEGKAEEKEINLNFSSSEDVFFKHDREWILEAIVNIIKNSIEHSKNGTNIQINMYNNHPNLKIEISDQGDGISEDDLPLIFNRFYKGKQQKKRDSIGIGLSLSKSIIEGHGGYIDVKSKKDFGSVFTIIFILPS